MTLSKAARRVIVGITAVLTLLCQSTALAHSTARSAAQSAGVEAHSPCHDAGGSDAQRPAHYVHPVQCLSQATSSSPALPDIPQLAGLPALIVHVTAFGVADTGLSVSDLPPPRGEPPPLTILHCCLRN